MKVVVDIFGADRGPGEVIKGAIDAIEQNKELTVVLVGDESVIAEELAKYDIDKNRVVVEHAPEIVTNNESPTMAIKTKKNSSLVKALEITKNDEEVVGLVSAGSTGAVLAGGIFKVGRIKGVLRPALCPFMPTLTGGRVCIVDCGANMDCKPEYLVQFAIMGSEYMKTVCGIENPRVALVSVGVEDKKGNELTHEVFARLKEMPSINFVGNMEARDALSGDYDVLVCDGFVGNVLTKTVEGTAKMVTTMLKKEIKASKSAKIGALFMKKALGNLKASMNYQAFGGAAFLGIEKVLVKSHGSSKALAITASINTVIRTSQCDLVKNIQSAISAQKATDNE